MQGNESSDRSARREAGGQRQPEGRSAPSLRARRRRRQEPRDERGQSTIDFAVGMSLFLVSLSFVLVFVPGMLEPFTAGTQEETPTVNRVADELSQQLLGDSSRPYVLDATCTTAFFDGTNPADCRFDGATLQEQVGVKSWTRVNVTISGDPTDSGSDAILCRDTSNDALVDVGDGDCDVALSRGPKPSGSGGETISAQRVVQLDGEDVTIRVVMW